MMTDAELLADIEAEESQAIGSITGELALQRADALDRYNSRLYGNEVAGRSSIVSSAVRDTIESVMPSMARVFLSGDAVGKFEPIGPGDEQAAERESDVVNWYIFAKGGGWLAIHNAIKDAMLLKNGYVRVHWTTDQAVSIETYTGKSAEELTMLLQDDEVQIVEANEVPGPATIDMATGQQMPGAPLYDVRINRVRPMEYAKLEAVPPDELLVSSRLRAVCLAEADFVQHRKRVTLGELRASGYKVDDGLSDDESGNEEALSRNRFSESSTMDDNTSDASRRLVLFKETWIRIDLRGKGTPQLWRVCSVGKTVLSKDECEFIPIAGFAALIYQHSHVGVSYYDLISDLALLETTVLRQYLDTLYLATQGRTAVNSDRVNIDDLLTSRPGGVVRVEGDPGSAIMPLTHADVSGPAMQGLEYIQGLREHRTGITRYNQGLDANTLNKTASGIQMIQSAAQGRQELIARCLAEGVRDLFLIVHALASKHATREIQIQLKGNWVPVNPRDWTKRTDFTVSVALGTGAPEQQMQKMMALTPMLEKLVMRGMVNDSNIYEWAKEMLRVAGYRSTSRYLTEPDPAKPPAQTPPPPEVLAAQAQAQGLVEKAKVDGEYGLKRAAGDSEMDMRREQLKQEGELQKALINAAKDALIEASRQQSQMLGAAGLPMGQDAVMQGLAEMASKLTQLVSQMRAPQPPGVQ